METTEERMVRDLKENLQKIKELRDEIAELRSNRLLSLRYYLEEFHDKLIFCDHGERDKFFIPKHIALQRVQELEDIGHEKLYSAFSTSKRKLLSIVDHYMKDMQLGFLEHDQELKSTPQG